jgi:hypothetical protein
MTATKNTYYDKKYYDEHIDQIRKAQKQFYEKNKDALNKINLEYYNTNKERLNQKILCKCNGRYTYKNKSQHFKSRLHQIYLSNYNNSSDDD